MFCTNFDLKELIDISPAAGSVYIKSVCEPFDAEMEMDWERIQNWLTHFGLDVQRTHVSGHAAANQLKEFVEQVQPKTVVPVHTENAQTYAKWTKNVYLLNEPGATLSL